MNVSTAEAKAKFSDLVKRAESGEEINVTRHGKVVARILPPQSGQTRKPLLGAFEDQPFSMSEDFNELGSEWDDYVR